MNVLYSTKRVIFFFFCSIILVFSYQSYGQFSVVSTQPVHGDANVDTAATLSITFNTAIDTTARFPYPGNFFISIYFEPDSLVSEPDSFSFSPDLRTVNIHNLHLSEFTVYRFIIHNAVSQVGDSLEVPFDITFTTNPMMPYSASVSGSIDYPDNDPAGAVVVLFDGNPFEGEEESSVQFWSVVSSTSGLYTIDYVDSSFYWPFVVKDFIINESGEIELQQGSSLGFLDSNGDNRPDSIYVFMGTSITGLNLTLSDAYYQTARNPFTNLLTLAQTWSADAFLVQFGGDNFNLDGTALFWQHAFFSPSLNQHKVWFTIGDLIAAVKPDTMEADTIALPQNWLNSDTVMTIAEDHGGRDFRQQHPDARISGRCSYFRFDDDKDQIFSNHKSNASFSPTASVDLVNIKESQTFSMPAVWSLDYYSDSAEVDLYFLIDALDGTVLNEAATALAAEQLAYPIARNWMPDAKLWGLGTHLSSVDSIGKSDLWVSLYYSVTMDSLYGVFVWGKIPIMEGLMGWIPPDTITVPAGWLDSDVCVAVAEANGGATYRTTNQDVFVSANLGRRYYGKNPEQNVWEFVYSSWTSSVMLVIVVDPYTGNIINSLDNPDNKKLPQKFTLYQNYPNPFNPATTISFDLPEYTRVSLAIYNLIGQKVATLLDKEMKAGTHEITWNAEEFASGIYIYKISAGNHSEIKKCILLK